MDIVVVTTIFSSLFLVIAAAEPLAARLRLPYSAILAGLGILIGGGATFFLNTHLTDALNPVAEAILGLPIRANVFLYVFLPTLLFQATLGMNLQRMLEDWVPILMLAVVAVVVATFSVGYALVWVSPLPLTACLLIGAIVSTTDPSAVVSIFRSIAAPKRLARLIEGESLLNDAAAIALFGVFLGYVTADISQPALSGTLSRFPMLIIGGVLTGWVVARVALWIMTFFARYDRAIISVSVALPYMAYIGAEQTIGASGVIAVVTAGLSFKLAAPSRLPPVSWTNLCETWDLLAHWAGALIFILAALLIPRMLQTIRVDDVLLVFVVIVSATIARAAILFVLLPLLTRLRLSPKVNMPYRAAILWGGLRGALTLALALAVTESAAVPLEIKRLVGILATGFTLFTLIVQGTTLRFIIRLLKLDRLSPVDQALSNQVVAVALQTVRDNLGETTSMFNLPHDVVRAEAKQFAVRVDDAVHRSENNKGISDHERITLGLIALAIAERNAIVARVRERTFPLHLAERLIIDAGRLIDGARNSGRTGYNRAAKTSVGYKRDYRIALLLHNKLQWSAPLARISKERFDVLEAQSAVFADLDGFINARIKRLHGKRVAELLQDLLSRRKVMVETALEGLRLQFPGYAEELGRRLIQRTALRLEEKEYSALFEQGLVGAELYTSLIQDINLRRTVAEKRHDLDLSIQRSTLIKQYPLFAELDPENLGQLSRYLQTRYVNADTLIISNNKIEKIVFFIVSGAVEVEIAGRTTRLGPGEVFGLMTFIPGSYTRMKARTIAPSTLLVLDEAKFLRLLEKSSRLQKVVNDRVQSRRQV